MKNCYMVFSTLLSRLSLFVGENSAIIGHEAVRKKRFDVELAHSLGKMIETSFTLQRFQRYPRIYQYPSPTTGVLKSTSTLRYLRVLQKTFC